MSRVIRLVLLVLVAAGLASVTASGPASAAPPALYTPWPSCVGDADGKYCVESVTRNSAAVAPVDCGTPGTYEEPYVDLIGAGDVRFGVDKTVVDGSGCGDILGDVDPLAQWQFVVNTGSIVPRELFGHIQGVTFSTGGNASTGYEFTMTFNPTSIAFTNSSCSYDGGCGDDTTSADYDYAGFVTGYVTDLASSGLSASEIADRTGYVHVYSAQDAYEIYDSATNSIEVRMANTHLMADGTTVFHGSYQSFLPDAMLVNDMNVPDPTTLTTGSFSITRVGSGSAPATVTRVSGGVEISIPSITFSNPRYRIRPKPTAPGVPRRVKVTKPTAHTAKVSFKRPLADGGAAITKYQARCRKGSAAWHQAAAGAPPVVVKSLPRGSVSCQVRAVNRLGAGPWSVRRSS